MDTGGIREAGWNSQRNSDQQSWYTVPRNSAQVCAEQKINIPVPVLGSTAFWQAVQGQGTDRQVTDKTLQVVL